MIRFCTRGLFIHLSLPSYPGCGGFQLWGLRTHKDNLRNNNIFEMAPKAKPSIMYIFPGMFYYLCNQKFGNHQGGLKSKIKPHN